MSSHKGLSPNEIRAELILRGIRVKDIAKEAGVAPEAVSMAISGKSRNKGYRIRPFIAKALGRNTGEIWPDEAPANPEPLRKVLAR